MVPSFCLQLCYFFPVLATWSNVEKELNQLKKPTWIFVKGELNIDLIKTLSPAK